MVFGIVPVLLLFAVLAAVALSAKRAASVDRNAALRSE
jgi:hypothetical protein